MIHSFVKRFEQLFPEYSQLPPWEVIQQLEQLLTRWTAGQNISIHPTAVVEQNVVLKPPIVIGAHAFVGANAYLRGPVFIDEAVSIGAGCEIKQSVIFSSTAIAHFNYVGNSIVGSHVNFEAGSVAANHYNERSDKNISVLYDGAVVTTGVTKFGALVGDHARIGANAVLSPGTLLPARFTVKRLELIDQVSDFLNRTAGDPSGR